MALKLKSTIRAKVVVPEGDFHVEFKRLKQNEVLKWQSEFKKVQTEAEANPSDLELQKRRELALYEMLNGVVAEIEGLEDDEGPVTVERFREQNLYTDIMHEIVRVYFDHVTGGKKNT
jgi:hypothetical protein